MVASLFAAAAQASAPSNPCACCEVMAAGPACAASCIPAQIASAAARGDLGRGGAWPVISGRPGAPTSNAPAEPPPRG